MKMATRIALLQWQSNPADPANFIRLVVAWVTPGMRETTGSNGAREHPKLHGPSNSRLHFLAGAFSATVVFGVATLAWFWSHSMPIRSAEEQAIYDGCLYRQNGNGVACDAYMRVIARERAAAAAAIAAERAAEAELFQQAAKLRAAGVNGCQIESWAADAGFVGSELSDASGIPLAELQAKCWPAPKPAQPGLVSDAEWQALLGGAKGGAAGNPFCKIGFALSRMSEASAFHQQSGTCNPQELAPKGAPPGHR